MVITTIIAERGKREFGLQLAKGIKGGGSSQLHAKGLEGENIKSGVTKRN